jgi:ankyrin repeat protein
MLSNIDTLSTEDAQRILRFLCCAKRELTVPELIEVIAIELGDNPTLNIDGRYSGADDIRKVCPGLIEVDVHQEGELDTVRLSHYSVREYLESEQIRQHEVAKFGVDISESHTEAANICLTYLLEPGLSERMIWVIEYPLASYAAELWFMHFRDVKTWTPELKRLTMRLFRDPRAFQSWIKIWDSDWEGEHVKSSDRSPVYYASLLGLDSVISEILGPESPNDLLENPLIKDTSQLVNIRSGRHGTPLQAASFGGHEKAVKVLLNYRADVSTGGGKYGSALQAGAYKGHDRVVQMLLNNKANIKSQARFVESALQGAALNGHVEVIKALLACDGEISFQIGCFTNSLQAASYKGYYGVAQLLLNNIGIFKAHNGFYGNSLQTAALKGYTDIVQLLLNRNADVNAKAGQYGTALQAASFGGHEDIMTLLLKSDAEVNALGGQYGTALQAASFKGYKNAVQILFDNKAGVGVLGGEFGSALQAAEVGKHTEIAQLLRSSLSTTDDSGVEQVPSQSVITDLGPLSIIQIPGGKQEPVVAAYRRGSASIAQASNFDTVLLIDDTGSMQLAYESDPYWMIGKSRWMLLIDSLTHLVDILLHHGTDSMAVHFINSPEKNVEDIQSGQQIINLLSNEIELERSAGGTFLTRSLERILSPYLNRLSHINKNAKKAENEGNPPLMFPKRLNIVVVSDGNADDSSDTEEYIVDVAKELDRLDAPPNQVRIHVLQIGEDEEASKWLKMFDARLHAAYPMRDVRVPARINSLQIGILTLSFRSQMLGHLIVPTPSAVLFKTDLSRYCLKKPYGILTMRAWNYRID